MSPASTAVSGTYSSTPASGAPEDTRLVVSLDVEEDDWGVHPNARGVTNVSVLPALARRLAVVGVRPTFFVSYVVAADVRAMAHVQEAAVIANGEIAAHLHPWNTPPFDVVPQGALGALARYPAVQQRAKLDVITDTLAGATGTMPRAFRAGRLSLSPETVRALLGAGYAIDSSVSAYWQPDDEPIEVAVPGDAWRGAYALGVPGATRSLVEVPMTAGFSRAPFARWEPVARLMDTRLGRRLRLAGIANRSGLLRRIVLSPEHDTVADMLALWALLRAQGARVAQLFLHSPSLKPGLTPYGRDAEAVRTLVESIERFVEHAARPGGLRPATISDAAADSARKSS